MNAPHFSNLLRTTALALSLSLCIGASADIITLKDGRRLEGEIVGQTKTTLRIKVNSFAVVEVAATQVKSIETKETPWQVLEKRLKLLAPNDADGHFQLAEWCKEHNMPKKRRELLQKVITLNTDHAEARLALGYIHDNGKWLTEADYYKAKGFEKYRGRWLPKDEVKVLKTKDSMTKAVKKHLIQFRRGRKKAIAAESAILDLHPPEIAGPILAKHLDDKKDSVRILIARALGEMKYQGAHTALLKLAQKDDSYDVAQAASKALWNLELTESTGSSRTAFVQGLFSNSKKLRSRTANLLGEIQDPTTIPYLIEGLYLVKTKIVTKVREISGVSRGGVRRRGLFGEYNLPTSGRTSVGRTQRVREKVYVFNSSARRALKDMTAVDYDYDKQAWFKWWKTEAEKQSKSPAKKQKP